MGAPPCIMVGRTISHYRIVEKLGGGGMGVVHKAEDKRLHHFAAPQVVARGSSLLQFSNQNRRSGLLVDLR